MYEFLKNLHSYWAYLVLLLAIIFVLAILYYFVTKKPLHRGIRKVAFFTTLSFHIQFLIGIGLYIVSPIIKGAWSSGMGMKDSALRLLMMEHPLMMFTAVILITVANSKLKRVNHVTTSILIFSLLAAICFIRIPWTQWMASGI